VRCPRWIARWDADALVQNLSIRTPRLTLQEKSYTFTTLPTVTQFAKESLLKGVPPHLTPESSPIGQILPDNLSPNNNLNNARPGQIIFWRVEQPDKAYHFEQGDKRDRKVRAELDSIMQAIVEVVENLPNEIPLQILLTSDHGRLMNPNAPRQLPVPAGFEAHGRAAWGNLDQAFPECGYVIDEKLKAGWDYLVNDLAWHRIYKSLGVRRVTKPTGELRLSRTGDCFPKKCWSPGLSSCETQTS